ncbi:MAG: hypothetical protein NT075_07265 [Chloroflexi bacterium]|nr:hypothetical protein [Chloroflexota bacterium]
MNSPTIRAKKGHVVLSRIIYGAIFVLMLLLSGLAHRTYAQTTSVGLSDPADGSSNGTLPPGTIPNQALYLPLISVNAQSVSPRVFDAIPVIAPPVDHPAAINGDLNLALRGYISITAALTLVDINGDVDLDAPQLIGLFSPPRLPKFVGTYQVYDWNWGCGPHGCRGDLLTEPESTLLEVATTPGEPLFIPTRNAEILGGGYKVLVLYAEAHRITLTYTRQDTPAVGYVVQLEDITVDPALLALYNQLDAAGRSKLPALRQNEDFGIATGATMKLAIRDTGSFLDPRSRKDWWFGFQTLLR